MPTFPDGFWDRGYEADNGNTYGVTVPRYYFDCGLHRQWDGSSEGGAGRLPPGYIMRHVNLRSNSDGTRRSFPCSRKEAGWWPFIGSTVTLPRQNGTMDTYTVVSYNSERYQPLRYQRKKR